MNKQQPFFYSQSEATESSPHPDQLTFALLNDLYQKDGPIARAYRHIGVVIQPISPFVLVQGTLYVDKEKELQQLFPAMSCLNATHTPAIVRLQGFWRTIKNMNKLRQARIDMVQVAEDIKHALQKPVASTWEEARQALLKDYELVYLANLSATLKQPDTELPVLNPPTGITGNSLNLQDTSPFYTPEHIERLSAADRIREYGRWLMCARLHAMRTHLPEPLVASTPPNPPLPAILTDLPTAATPTKALGLSPGIATGIATRDPHTTLPNAIFVTTTLAPTLAPDIKHFRGIVSAQGGLLSHLAILAREQQIPIVSKYPIDTIEDGQTITINGKTGEITFA